MLTQWCHSSRRHPLPVPTRACYWTFFDGPLHCWSACSQLAFVGVNSFLIVCAMNGWKNGFWWRLLWVRRIEASHQWGVQHFREKSSSFIRCFSFARLRWRHWNRGLPRSVVAQVRRKPRFKTTGQGRLAFPHNVPHRQTVLKNLTGEVLVANFGTMFLFCRNT